MIYNHKRSFFQWKYSFFFLFLLFLVPFVSSVAIDNPNIPLVRTPASIGVSSWNDLEDIPEGFADNIDNQSVGGADWSEITSIPAGFADDVDNDTDTFVANYSDYLITKTYASNDTDFNATGLIANWSLVIGSLEEVLWNANYSTFLTHITWANAVNGTLMLSSNWNATNESYYLVSNPFEYYNSTTFPNTTYYNATQSQVVAGTINAGTLADTQHPDARYDGVTFNFTEVALSSGLDLRINFTGIVSFNRGVMRYKTSSLSGAYPLIQLWNYDTSLWEDYSVVATSTSFATITQPVFDSTDHVSGGVVQMRIYKVSNGNINNHYYVDWIAISKGFGTPSGEEVDPYSWHKNSIGDTANYTTTGNVSASYFFGNGSQLTGITSGDATWLSNWTVYNTTWSNMTNTSYYLISSWNTNYTTNNPKWLNTTNATYHAYNSTGLIKNWNSTGYIKNWNATGYIKNWNSTGYISNWSQIIGISGEPLWNANYSAFLTHIPWTTAMNGTLFKTSQWNATNTSYMTFPDWNATNTSYYLASNPSGFFNTSNTNNCTVGQYVQNLTLNSSGAFGVCSAPSSSGGNPFDQVLNTTYNVTFGGVTSTGNITISNGNLTLNNGKLRIYNKSLDPDQIEMVTGSWVGVIEESTTGDILLSTNGDYITSYDHFKPSSNNAYTLGTNSYKWSTIYGYTGAFTTSVTAPTITAGDVLNTEGELRGARETVYLGTAKVWDTPIYFSIEGIECTGSACFSPRINRGSIIGLSILGNGECDAEAYITVTVDGSLIYDGISISGSGTSTWQDSETYTRGEFQFGDSIACYFNLVDGECDGQEFVCWVEVQYDS